MKKEIPLDEASRDLYHRLYQENRRIEFYLNRTEFTDCNDIEWSAHAASLMPQQGPNVEIVSYSNIGPMDAIRDLKMALAKLGYDPKLRATGVFYRTEALS